MRLNKIIVSSFLSVLLLGISSVDVSAEGVEMGVCEVPGTSGSGFKSFLSVSDITATGSPQYQFLNYETSDYSNLRITDDGYIAAAMGSYYGEIGDKFIVTFSNGTQTKVVKGEAKADQHTSSQCYGMSMAHDGSVIEPLFTTTTSGSGSNPSALDTAWYHGNVGWAYEEFAEDYSITSIKKVTGSITSTQELTQKTNTFDDSDDPVGESDLSYNLALKEEEERVAAEIEAAAIKKAKEEEPKIMAIYIPNSAHNRLVFLDTEFEQNRELVQAAFIVYERIDDEDHYFLTASLNVFVNVRVSEAFENYTGIKGGFLGNEGLTKLDAREVLNSFIEDNDLNSEESLLIGHGVQQDLQVLDCFGCDLYSEYYDTLTGAREILNKTDNLKLSDLLLEAGLVQDTAHDAYQDARNVVPVYGHLMYVKYRNEKGE